MSAGTQPWARRAVIPVAVAFLGLGIYGLREATQSRHEVMHPDSRLRVVVEGRSNRSEPAQTTEAALRAHLRFCELEVGSRIQGDLQPVAGESNHFVAVFAPALDGTDRKQFRGCVEDWVVDNHLVDVISMEEYRAS